MLERCVDADRQELHVTRIPPPRGFSFGRTELPHAMTDRLPEEILKAVSSLALHVPDHRFRDTSRNPPLARVDASSSVVLLVCKRWLRIATPVLYDTVIVCSTAQAQALVNALLQEPQFARLVKRIRLEINCPPALANIAKWFSALEEVAVAASMGYDARLNNMHKFLRSVNPSAGHFTVYNTSSDGWDRIRSALKHWNKLVRLRLCDHVWRAQQLIQRTITLSERVYNTSDYEALISIASSSATLQSIYVPITTMSSYSNDYWTRLKTVMLAPQPKRVVLVVRHLLQVPRKDFAAFETFNSPAFLRDGPARRHSI